MLNWLRKYDTFDGENKTPSRMPNTPEQKIMELEAKVFFGASGSGFRQEGGYILYDD